MLTIQKYGQKRVSVKHINFFKNKFGQTKEKFGQEMNNLKMKTNNFEEQAHYLVKKNEQINQTTE